MSIASLRRGELAGSRAEAPGDAWASHWWRSDAQDALRQLGSDAGGLTEEAAAGRLRSHGPNVLARASRASRLWRGARRLSNPLVLVLLAAGAVSAATGQGASAGIIAAVLVLSVVVDQWQQQRAEQAAARLASQVAVMARVLRGGVEREVPMADLVPGDVVRLAAGSLVPADGLLLQAQDLFVQQSALTGEPFPVEKHAGPAPAAAAGQEAAGALFMGSSVVSGTATLLLCRTGMDTRMGELAHLLLADRRGLALENDLRHFGTLILRIATVLVLFVLLAGGLLGRPWLESFLFALALAVGITPELLPAVVTASLARGAMRLAQQQVVVRHMAAIHNLGSMDVLCTDKTGTLTEARIALAQHLDIEGTDSACVLENAWLNSHFESGIRTPLEEAVLAHPGFVVGDWHKVDEVPFDFERRRVSVLVDHPGERRLCLKGAPAEVLALCDRWQAADGPRAWTAEARARAQATLERLEAAGQRVLGVAFKTVPATLDDATLQDETALVFAGYAAFLDPPRSDARGALASLQAQGVRVKVLTGDSDLVTRHVCEAIGLRCGKVMLGTEVAALDDRALARRVGGCDAFCRLDPAQKLRVIRALRGAGHVVGYLGDGINDGPALHESDVGISVDGATETARAAADLILLRRDLAVLSAAVTEGRRTFANTRKYILLGTSSNFGNMASMAGAAVLLPFLPMLPVQVLLTNLLYDGVSATLPLDRVEPADLARPQHWDMALLRRFMLVIGPVSSLFDLLTFALLLLVLNASAPQFQSGWFIESMATQVLAMFVIRTPGPALAGRPHPALAAAAAAVLLAAALLPYTPAGPVFGLVPLPPAYYAALAVMTLAYLVALELAKHAFWRHARRTLPRPPRRRPR
ncbi:MAG: magnesium-translocating P-type ATPase [Ramlibacter sp.]